MNLEQRYNSVVYGKNFHYVEVPGLMEADLNSSVGFGLSEGPLWVFAVRDCCSVALLGDNGLGGITHYHLDRGSPEAYLEEVLQAMREKGQTSIYSALVGGDSEHIMRIRNVLEQLGVPIVSQFIDNGALVNDGGRKVRHWLDKSIVFFPKDKEAIVQVRDYTEYRYQRLPMRRWYL